jgi:hypothetical protein
MGVRVHVRACVCMGVRVHVRACVRVHVRATVLAPGRAKGHADRSAKARLIPAALRCRP